MKRRLIAALLTGFGFYVLSDILLWQRIFEANRLWKFDPQYQSGHVTILIGMVGIGVVLLWDAGLWALWWGGSLYALCFGGAADVFYYWFDGRQLPAVQPWLDQSRLILFKPGHGDVSSPELLASSATWAVICAVAMVLLATDRGRIKRWLYSLSKR